MSLRLREDHWWRAGRKRAVLLGAVPDPRSEPDTNWDPEWLKELNNDAFEPARIGDVWVARSDPADGKIQSFRKEGREDWQVVGYGLTCPNERCEHGLHIWTHASDCEARFGNKPCKHGGPSCWTWTGTIEEGNLTAQPSLFVNHKSCGWHGFLTNGSMSGNVEVIND